jgi:zinc transporter 9
MLHTDYRRSFLAGALPLSMSLSQSQLRLISAIGMGVLVGTSLVVIIPEGIEAVYTAGAGVHTHGARGLSHIDSVAARWTDAAFLDRSPFGVPDTPKAIAPRTTSVADAINAMPGPVLPASEHDPIADAIADVKANVEKEGSPPQIPPVEEHHEQGPPTFYIGLSLILGFILMFLIDKLPRHASETLQPSPPTRHISLNNLSQSVSNEDEEASESFLHSLTPSPKQTRSLATTTGLVIHAAADGIAMGASASTANTKLGLIIFVAIMVHKAPAAFGLTSVLLKQGLSKRAARGHLIIFSLAAPIGALSTWLLVNILGAGGMEGERGQWWTGMLLLFSAGTFL